MSLIKGFHTEQLKALKVRLEHFNRVPSVTNMLLAYNLMELIFVKKYTQSKMIFENKDILRYDKLKALALNNKNIPERILAFKKSLEKWESLTQETIEETENAKP